MPISFDKVSQDAPALLDLVKTAAVSLEKANTGSMREAEVCLVLDFSGSMSARYRRGEVQRLAERCLALATQLDKDGTVQVYFFDTKVRFGGELTIQNYKDRINELMAGNTPYYATHYAPVFHEIAREYGYEITGEKKRLFSRKSADSAPTNAETPIFVIFQTDGDAGDQAAAEEAMIAVSSKPIFWKFISVGTEPVTFLDRLDNMSGRTVDNANFQPIGEPETISNKDLFDLLLVEYPDWVSAAQAKGILK